MTENSDRTERLLEALVYAPIGVGLYLKETAPTFIEMFVSRGRAEVDRRHREVQQRVTTARSLGQVVLAFGPPMARERVSQTVADARRRAEEFVAGPAAEAPEAPPVGEPATTSPVFAAPGAPDTTAPVAPPAPLPPFPPAPVANRASWNGSASSPASGELPIPGYDALSASQVVERLVGLAPEELDAVHAYEVSHRQRRTILGKIEQLAG